MLTFRFRKCAYFCCMHHILNLNKACLHCGKRNNLCSPSKRLVLQVQKQRTVISLPKGTEPKTKRSSLLNKGKLPQQECMMKKQWKMNWRLYTHRQASKQHGHNLLIVKLLSPNVTSHSQTPLKHHTLSHPTRTHRSHSTSADHSPHLQITLHIYISDGARMSSILRIMRTSCVARRICCFLAISVSITFCSRMSATQQQQVIAHHLATITLQPFSPGGAGLRKL